jgi:hypothetical protein
MMRTLLHLLQLFVKGFSVHGGSLQLPLQLRQLLRLVCRLVTAMLRAHRTFGQRCESCVTRRGLQPAGICFQ